MSLIGKGSRSQIFDHSSVHGYEQQCNLLQPLYSIVHIFFSDFSIHYVLRTCTSSYDSIESDWCTISQPNKPNLDICAFYRPPNSPRQLSRNLNDEINSYSGKNNNSITLIGGDFNLSDIDWPNNIV